MSSSSTDLPLPSSVTSLPLMVPDPRVMIATRREMSDGRLPLHWRDHCAHLALPLNVCRQSHFYAPWECTNERHAYEICQHEDWLIRRDMTQQQSKLDNIHQKIKSIQTPKEEK